MSGLFFTICAVGEAHGLIVRKIVDRKLQLAYQYDQFGHLQSRISPVNVVEDGQEDLAVRDIRYIAEENELLEELHEIE